MGIGNLGFRCIAVFALASGLACAVAESSAMVGSCSIEQPGEASRHGLSSYLETALATADSGGLGSMALTLACVSADGSTSDELIFVLPYLQGGVAPGTYQIVDPDGADPLSVPHPRRAFATFLRTSVLRVSLIARSGSIHITQAGDGSVSGAYQLALTPEEEGRRGRLVVGGAFQAYRGPP